MKRLAVPLLLLVAAAGGWWVFEQQQAIQAEAMRQAELDRELVQQQQQQQQQQMPIIPTAEAVQAARQAAEARRAAMEREAAGRPIPPTPTVPPLTRAIRIVPVAALLGSDEEPDSADHTWSLVLADQSPRSHALCLAMLQRLTLIDADAAKPRPAVPTRPIFWLLARPAAEVANLSEITCDQLVAGLDKTRALANGMGGDIGPKFLAVAVRGAVVHDVIFDLSEIPDSELGRAVRLWGEILADDPETWQASIRLVSWQEAFRGFLIRYSQPIEGWIGSRPAAAGPATPVRFSILK
jgi:hypothetical protein